ncbi:MAG: condensation domain-containing protein [Planctomycetaceae bacterium]|jgi:NRPS condensation-like uncharacterized protein|nr:condensation domain-containing protein [Planctomycetaceae bacterium]
MLPLTVFEKYMLLDDSPAYPMDSFRYLRFSGEFDIELFELSIASVVRFQPLLSSRIRHDKWLGFIWEQIDQPLFIKKINTNASTADSPVPEQIDIFNEAGFKVYIVSGSDGYSVLFQFHHTVSDGLGEMDLIADILTDYNDRVNGKIPIENTRNLDPSLLKYRGSSGLTIAKYFRFFIDTAFTTNQLLFRFPSPILPCTKRDLSVYDEDYYKYIASELSTELTSDYFSFAKKNKVTVNDLLISDLFLSMNKFRQECGNSRRKAWMRISMPISLRGEEHKMMPASNNVTMVFLDRRNSDCADAEKLLRGVNRETQWIKRAEQKHVLLLSLRICDLMPHGLELMLWSMACRATVVLSNLGKVFDKVQVPRRFDGCLVVGNAILEEVNASPPIRFGTLASISALTYAGKLRIILRFDKKNLPKEKATQLLEIYTTQFAK